MSNQIRQEQLYQDLSIILVLVKKLFKRILGKTNQQSLSSSRQIFNDQSFTVSRCTQLMVKYKKHSIKKASSLNIIGRFMCRIKQILSQIIVCIPKQKIQIMVILKKIDLITIKMISGENSSTLIISLLQIISNCNSKLVHSLRIKSANIKQAKESKQSITISKQLIEKQSIKENNDIKIKEADAKQSQLQMVMNNLQKYSILGIDREYLRGRYFDMKSQQSSTFFQQSMLRNRNIKSVMSDYDKQYNKMVSKKNSARPQSKKTLNQQYLQSMPISWQINISQSQSSNLFHRKRQVPSRSANIPRSIMNKSNQTFSYTVMEESTQVRIDSHRSTYEQKMIKSRNKKTVKLSNTIINLPEALSNQKAKGINPQRVNFFKKSQEHLKFRYKYYQNKSFNTTPLNNKFKVLNPETLYNTIYNR